ncbi:hypothetical protein [Candidatus Poriferisodalis sp.]|uniref:hypothetical protein n=1 Tax=Candidatus Poriferisodalis sp. TaxID=3101277 RepID=UPI003B5250F2
MEILAAAASENSNGSVIELPDPWTIAFALAALALTAGGLLLHGVIFFIRRQDRQSRFQSEQLHSTFIHLERSLDTLRANWTRTDVRLAVVVSELAAKGHLSSPPDAQ